MSRTLGSKNKNGTYISIDRCNAKTLNLLSELDKYTKSILSNQAFSRHVDFNAIESCRNSLQTIVDNKLTNANI
jgi:glutathionyl-hydroquinone reductase